MNLFSQVDLANSLYGKYKESWEANQFEESKEYLVRLVNKDYIVSKSYYGFIHNNLGRVYWKLGVIDSAEFHYNEALVYCSAEDEPTQYLLNSIYNNIALLYDQKSQYKLAIEFYQQSINALSKVTSRGSKYYQRISASYLNYSISSYNQEDYKEALIWLKLAKEYKEDYELPYLGSAYYNLARTYQALNNSFDADYYYNKGINQWTIELGIETYHLAGIYLNYGTFLIEYGNPHSGLIYYNKALQNYLTNYGRYHPYTSNCYRSIAEYYLKKNDNKEALTFAQQAIISLFPGYYDIGLFTNPRIPKSLLDIELLKNYRIKVKALEGLSQINRDSIIKEEKLYSHDDILNFTLETIELEIVLLHKIQDSYMDQESRLYLAKNQKEIFIDGIEIANRLHILSKDSKYLSQSYKIASQGKSLELQFELEEKQRFYLESMNDPTADSILELKNEIFSYQNMIHLEQKKLAPDSAIILMWRDTLFDMKRDYENSVTQIWGDRNNPGIKNTSIDPDHLSLTQKKLNKNQTLIEYAISNNSVDGHREMFTFVITRKECHVINTKLDITFFRDLVILNQKLSEYDFTESSSSSKDSLYNSLKNLYDVLISPVEKWIIGNQLLIIPDEELALLPFDVLMKEDKGNEETDSYEIHYLLKDYAISYATNSQLLQNPKIPRLKAPGILAINQTSLNSINTSEFNLFGAEEEINEVFKIFRGKKLSQENDKQGLLNEIRGNEILHFALHSFSENNSLSSAYIQLDSDDDSIYSNRLFDYEISSIQLASPMVVLSSCGTGSGKLYSGEGAMSLSRSFLLAGSESVVHTLWPVEDKSSSEIMIEYYKGLKRGWNKSKALQKAKLSFLENTSPTFFHPHFWAGYQITRNTQSIILSRVLVIGFGVVGLFFVLLTVFWRYRRTKS